MRSLLAVLVLVLLPAMSAVTVPAASVECTSLGELRPGETVTGVSAVPAGTVGFGLTWTSAYRLVVPEPGIVRVAAAADWFFEIRVLADCEDPASLVMTSGMAWDDPETWRALDAGAYWIEVRAESDPPGAFSLEAAYIEQPTPALPRWLPAHVHPGDHINIRDVGNVNRDSRMWIGAHEVDVFVWRDAFAPQDAWIDIPLELAEGGHAVTVANGDLTATACCLKIVPHLHPAFRTRIIDVTPPENGVGYRWDERAPLTVEVVNEGNGPGASRVCMFIGFPGGGGWSYPCYDYALAPGASTTIPVGVDLGGYVGDMRVSATSGAPQLLSIGPGSELRENEVMLPALVGGGAGAGFFVPGFVG